MVRPNLKSIEAPFTLRGCLSNECDDNMEDLLTRLDEKFANPAKLIDCIIPEIQRFQKIDNDDNKRFIAFVDVIDSGYRDLKKLNLEQEISNLHVLGIIEGKLPKHLQSEWYRMPHKQKIKICDKFSSLVEYLEIERAALEYGLSEIRSHSERRYGNVNNMEVKHVFYMNADHTTTDCKLY